MMKLASQLASNSGALVAVGVALTAGAGLTHKTSNAGFHAADMAVAAPVLHSSGVLRLATPAEQVTGSTRLAPRLSAWPQTPGFFPLAVWWQDSKLAAKAKAAGMTVMLGVGNVGSSGDTWPERFGDDNGELASIKAAGLKAIGGVYTPSTENTSANSVASMVALDQKIGGGTLIGYSAGDEPQCGGQGAQGYETEPAAIAAIKGFDPTRAVFLNHTAWVTAPLYAQCLSARIAALQSTDVASADSYAMTNPWSTQSGSDFNTIPYDGLSSQGLMVAGLVHYAKAGQPVWAYVETGGDNFGFSEQGNPLVASITNNIVTNLSGFSKFTPAWIGLSIDGRKVTGIVDATHAMVTNGPDVAKGGLAVTGGIRNSDCVGNLCLVSGNEYRARPFEVNAEVWSSVINGALGIEYFCHDATDYGFCLNDPATASNLATINADVQNYASVILSPTLGMCSMQQENFATQVFSVLTSCSDGSLTMSSQGAPMMALLKTGYLFAQSDRRGVAQATFKLLGMGGWTATVVYDSNAHYDSKNSGVKSSVKLDSAGRFSDTFGENGDDYQVKIYKIS